MNVHEVWFGDSIQASLLRGLLWPASALYGLGWKAYLGLYRLGLKHAAKPHSPIVCIGNFTVGGSGKSPATLHVAEVLRELGFPVVIGLSGYGSPKAEGATVAPDGELDAAEWGDEPAMVRWLMPDIPLIVGRRRVRAAELCAERFPDAVLLMDDGLQHMPLSIDIRIALDERHPKNRFLLPAGPYREPRSAKRADLILPAEFEAVAAPVALVMPNGDPVLGVSEEVQVLCALGRPDRFLDALERAGLRVGRKLLLTDHDPLAAGTLWDSFEPEKPIVVTAKDWVKLRGRSDLASRRIWIARHSVRIEPAEAFKRWLNEKTSERMEGKARL